MKRLALTFAAVALLCGLAFGLSSCATDGVGVGVGVGYGDYYHDGSWMYGNGWYHHHHDWGDRGWGWARPHRW